MAVRGTLQTRHLSGWALAVSCLLLLAGCKQSTETNTAAVGASTAPTATAAPVQQSQQSQLKPVVRRGLTSKDWFAKQSVTAEEARTVDAILSTIAAFGGPENDPIAAARWAEGRLESLALDGYGLTEISPLLTLKKLRTLTITGNKFSQAQIDELLAELPNLRTLAKDKDIKCDTKKHPRVTCID